MSKSRVLPENLIASFDVILEALLVRGIFVHGTTAVESTSVACRAFTGKTMRQNKSHGTYVTLTSGDGL